MTNTAAFREQKEHDTNSSKTRAESATVHIAGDPYIVGYLQVFEQHI